MFHILGRFEPGADFAKYSEAIHRVRDLHAAADDDPEVDWIDALEIVNEFGFVAESSTGTQPIRDFMLDENSMAQFKFGS